LIILPPTLPQLFAILFLATLGALLAELIVRSAPAFGFLGAIVLAGLGVIIFTYIPFPEIALEPKLEDIPAVRAVLGAAIVCGLFCYLKRRSYN
jgi:uncharacterized membrane protein YeaQ/YmgE (transglycosylase-associated protein family)